MSIPISDRKHQLRQQCRQLRRALDNDTRLQASHAVCANLEKWLVFQQSETILTYMPIKGEVDLTSLLTRHPQKRWVLPRILPEEGHRMLFHPYDPEHLIRHAFGMAEPSADLPVISVQDIELCLTPGLAFDRHGWRLGYGGGYFDRFLSEFAGVSVGTLYQALLLETVPHGEYDIPMHWLVTEAGLLQCIPE